MKINISPFTYLFYAILLLISHDQTIVAGISAVAIHEAAHLCVIALCGCSIEGIELTPIGLTIHRSGLTGHLQDFAVNLAGPLANLSVAAIWSLTALSGTLPVASNLFFGLLNLLPIATLDGGKALSALLSLRLSEYKSRSNCRVVSNIALLFLWMLSAAELLMLGGSPSLLFFCVGLFMAEKVKA